MKKETVFKIFSNIPTLYTERLSLRAMHPIDAEDMFDYAKRPEVTKYLLWREHESISFTRDYLIYIGRRYALGDFYDWAIIDRESRKMIGTCGFTRFDLPNNSAEIGYVLNPEYHGKGYATEAAKIVMRFGFEELGLHRIEAKHMIGNDASHRVMEKLGMREEGTFKDSYYVRREYRTVTVCAILENEYYKLRRV